MIFSLKVNKSIWFFEQQDLMLELLFFVNIKLFKFFFLEFRNFTQICVQVRISSPHQTSLEFCVSFKTVDSYPSSPLRNFLLIFDNILLLIYFFLFFCNTSNNFWLIWYSINAPKYLTLFPYYLINLYLRYLV